MKKRTISVALLMCLALSLTAKAESQDQDVYQSVKEANQIEILLANHENLFINCITYREDGSVRKNYSAFIEADIFLNEENEGKIAVREQGESDEEDIVYEVQGTGRSLLDFGEGEYITITEEDGFLVLQQKKVEEGREYIEFTIDQDSYEVQKAEHYSPKTDGTMGKYSELSVSYDVDGNT